MIPTASREAESNRMVAEFPINCEVLVTFMVPEGVGDGRSAKRQSLMLSCEAGPRLTATRLLVRRHGDVVIRRGVFVSDMVT